MASFSGSGALSGVGQGAQMGAQIGSIGGPKGMLIGAGVGALAGGVAGGLGRGKIKAAEDDIARELQMTAIKQGMQADIAQFQLDQLERPEIEAEVNRRREIANLAQQYAREGMPEAQRQAAVGDIERNQLNQLGAASSLGAGLRGLGQTQASTANQYRQLNAQDAAIAQANQGQYLGALGQLATAEATQEEFNLVDPYYEDFNRLYAEKQAYEGAAMQNRMGQLNYNLSLQQQRGAEAQQGVQDFSNSLMSIMSGGTAGGLGSAGAGGAGGGATGSAGAGGAGGGATGSGYGGTGIGLGI